MLKKASNIYQHKKTNKYFRLVYSGYAVSDLADASGHEKTVTNATFKRDYRLVRNPSRLTRMFVRKAGA